MKILVACEYSNTVSKEFRKLGHTVISCDLLPNDEDNTNHYQGDVFDIINDGFDMMIAHPPCTYLTYAGIRHWNAPGREGKRKEAVEFFLKLWDAPIKKICIENPVGYMNSIFVKPTQIIHPYFFGDKFMKKTCLWLKGLQPLVHIKENDLFNMATHTDIPEPDYICNGEKSKGKKIHWCEGVKGTSKENPRWKIRSKTFPGIAKAMAQQWGNVARTLGRVA